MNQPTTPDATAQSQATDWLASNQIWQLVALTPALGDLTITVTGNLRVGRSDSNDVVLATPQVSRQHAQLSLENNQLYVQDLGSANGTFINGKRVTGEPTALQVGDELGFADLQFVIDTDISDDFDADAVLDNIMTALAHAHPTTSVTEVADTTTVNEPLAAQSAHSDENIPMTSARVIETSTDAGATASTQTVPTPTVQTYAAKTTTSDTPVAPTPVAETAVVDANLTSTAQPTPMPTEAVTHSVTSPTPTPNAPQAAKKSSGLLMAVIVMVVIAAIVASMLL